MGAERGAEGLLPQASAPPGVPVTWLLGFRGNANLTSDEQGASGLSCRTRALSPVTAPFSLAPCLSTVHVVHSQKQQNRYTSPETREVSVFSVAGSPAAAALLRAHKP